LISEGTRQRKACWITFTADTTNVALSDILALLGEAGSKIIESGAVGVRDLHFVLAAVPCCA
jgi:hypothetical protein